jgi:succinate dehydrogenase / fumarate reductase flavoprotein subunit
LYAIGEANFSDHGANRLGASSLMQCTGDGYFILPYTITDYLADEIKTPRISTDLKEFEEAEKNARARLEKLISINGKQTASTFHKRLGKIMWDYCGMVRNEAVLRKLPAGRAETGILECLKVPAIDDINQDLESRQGGGL